MSSHADREHQRQAVLNCPEYKSGEWFTTRTVTALLGLHAQSGARLLGIMVDEGLLVCRRVKQKQGSSGSGTMYFCKPPTKLLRMPWRVHTDRELRCE